MARQLHALACAFECCGGRERGRSVADREQCRPAPVGYTEPSSELGDRSGNGEKFHSVFGGVARWVPVQCDGRGGTRDRKSKRAPAAVLFQREPALGEKVQVPWPVVGMAR